MKNVNFLMESLDAVYKSHFAHQYQGYKKYKNV